MAAIRKHCKQSTGRVEVMDPEKAAPVREKSGQLQTFEFSALAFKSRSRRLNAFW